MSDTSSPSAAILEAQQSFGRLVAYLAKQEGDVASAEDALAEAFEAALRQWPSSGVPKQPEAWLLAVARRRLIDRARRRKVRTQKEDHLIQYLEEAYLTTQREGLPELRLELMFVCAHPAIDPAMHAPLMMHTVLGINAERIGAAFLIAPGTMGQRLVRTKAKILEAKIPFHLPSAAELGARLESLLDAIYASYTTGWDAIHHPDSHATLSVEAIWLARVLNALLPDQAEVEGLLALMLLCEARRLARRSPLGEFVPLDEQDPEAWDLASIDEGLRLLWRASSRKVLGRFQLEAAIQAVHVDRRRTGQTRWEEIASLYQGLLHYAPTLSASINAAVALCFAGEPERGMALLNELDPLRCQSYQPYWAALAQLHEQRGQRHEAAYALERAIGLAQDPHQRAFLLKKLTKLTSQP